MIAFQRVPYSAQDCLRPEIRGTGTRPDAPSLSIPALPGATAVEKAASSAACPSPAASAHAFEGAGCSLRFTISGAIKLKEPIPRERRA